MKQRDDNRFHEPAEWTDPAQLRPSELPQSTASGRAARTAIWVGVAAGLATLSWFAAKSRPHPVRRQGDRGLERRNPLHFFLAGRYPRRRKIDRSMARPLFERRQSVYDSY